MSHIFLHAILPGLLALGLFLIPLDNAVKPYVFALLLALALACQGAPRLLSARLPGLSALASRAAPIFVRTAFAVVLASLGIFLVQKISYAMMCELRTPFHSEIMEGREVVKAALLASGSPLYTHLQDYPFFITLYGPVYYLAAALSGQAFGHGLPAARLVSAVSALGLALVAAGLARQRGAGVVLSLTAGALLLVSPILDYATHARPDLLAWLALYAGVLCLGPSLARPERPWPGVLAGSIWLFLALFTKQQTWAFVLALVVWTFWNPRTRGVARRLSLVLGVACAAGLAAALWGTQGEFWRQAVTFPRLMAGLSSYNGFGTAFARFGELLAMHGPLVAVAVWSVARRRQRPFGPFEALLLVGTASTALSLRWWGASVNHFLGVLVLLIVEAVVFLDAQVRAGRMWLACLLLATFFPLHFTVSLPGGPDPCRLEERRANVKRAESFLESLPGPVIMDAESAYLFLNSPAFGRLRLYDAFETEFYDLTGLWSLNDSRLAKDVAGRKVAAFVKGAAFLPARLTTLVEAYYRKDQIFGGLSVYVPRPEKAVLALGGEGQPETCDGGVCLELVQAQGLKNWGNYVQPRDNRGASLTLKIASGEPLGRVRLVAFPRLEAAGQSVGAYWSANGTTFVGLGEWGYDGAPQGTGFDTPRAVEFSTGSREVFVRFELTGAAQLWFNTAKPLFVWVAGPGLTPGRDAFR